MVILIESRKHREKSLRQAIHSLNKIENVVNIIKFKTICREKTNSDEFSKTDCLNENNLSTNAAFLMLTLDSSL